MAARPIEPSPEIVGHIFLVPLTDIELGQRLRPIDLDWADALANIMRNDGQLTPIEICKGSTAPYCVVAGGHRFVAAQRAGLAYILAREVSSDSAERRMREVQENLIKRDLDPIDRAAFMAELIALKKVQMGVDPAKDGRAASANSRWQKQLKEEAADANDTMTDAYGWSDEIAQRFGYSRRTIERDLLLHRRLLPSLVAQLRDNPIARNATQLRALAKQPDRLQRAIVELLVEGGARSVSEALATLNQRPKADPATKRLSAFIGTFQRMGAAEKKGALAQLAALLPAGFTLREGEETNKETNTAGLVAALDATFAIVAKLATGEEMVDDDEIEAARAQAQIALFEYRGIKIGGGAK